MVVSCVEVVAEVEEVEEEGGFAFLGGEVEGGCAGCVGESGAVVVCGCGAEGDVEVWCVGEDGGDEG